jgi:hypothetical protein
MDEMMDPENIFDYALLLGCCVLALAVALWMVVAR